MDTTQFLELVEHVGPEPDYHHHPSTGLAIPNEKAGDPGPLQEQGISIPAPYAVGHEMVQSASTVKIIQRPQPVDPDWRGAPIEPGSDRFVCARIIPGTRTIETTAPPIVALLLETGLYRQTDNPAQQRSTRGPSKTQLARDAKQLGINTRGLTKEQIAAAITAGQHAADEAPKTTDPAENGQEG